RDGVGERSAGIYSASGRAYRVQRWHALNDLLLPAHAAGAAANSLEWKSLVGATDVWRSAAAAKTLSQGTTKSLMPPLTKRERSIAAKFRRFEATKEKAKSLYDRADGILTEIARSLEGPKLTKMREQLIEAAKSKHSVRISDDGKTLHLREAAA